MQPKEHFFYPGLDALRGIAIILVLVYHSFGFFRIGWIGVDLFFVLSGFLITSLLLKSRHSAHYFRNFYARRVLRIFPLYYGVLALFFLAAPLVFSQKGSATTYGYYTANEWWFWLFLQNWLMIKKGLPPEPYLTHFWSLAIEEQFYLVWPLIVFSISNVRLLKKLILLLFAVAIATRLVLLYLFHMPAQALYLNSFTRMDSLAAGAFLAVHVYQQRKIPVKMIALVTVGFAGLLLWSGLAYHNFSQENEAFASVGYAVSALFFMCLCFLALHERPLLARLYFLKATGRISYGLYVFHLPVFLAGSALLNRLPPFATPAAKLAIPLICLALTFLISLVSYQILELPLLRLKNKFR